MPEGIPADTKLGDGDNGSLFIGTKGIATSGTYGGESRLLPDALMADYKRPAPSIPRVEGENPYLHWIKACINNTTAMSDFSYAGPLTEVANMGNVALLAGESDQHVVQLGRGDGGPGLASAIAHAIRPASRASYSAP